MAVEVRSAEERRRLVLNQRLLVRLGPHPEDNHILVALPGLGIDRIRPRITEEDERLPTHLLDGIVAGPVADGDVWHGQSKFVHILDPRGPALLVRHSTNISGTAPRATSARAAQRASVPMSDRRGRCSGTTRGQLGGAQPDERARSVVGAIVGS